MSWQTVLASLVGRPKHRRSPSQFQLIQLIQHHMRDPELDRRHLRMVRHKLEEQRPVFAGIPHDNICVENQAPFGVSSHRDHFHVRKREIHRRNRPQIVFMTPETDDGFHFHWHLAGDGSRQHCRRDDEIWHFHLVNIHGIRRGERCVMDFGRKDDFVACFFFMAGRSTFLRWSTWNLLPRCLIVPAIVETRLKIFPVNWVVLLRLHTKSVD